MKKLIALLLALMLLPGLALAEFDTAALLEQDGVLQSVDAQWNTVYSLSNPFYMGEIGESWQDYGDSLLVTLDYIERSDLYGMTLIRVDVLLMAYEMLGVDTVTFTVGGKSYAFTVSADVFEYDGVYQEEYVICLTDASLPFLKAIAQQKTDAPIPVMFSREGEVVLEAQVVISGEDAAHIYDLYIDLGGKKQDLKAIDDMWPVEIRKVK